MATPRHRTAPSTSYFVTTKCCQGRTVFQISETAEILTSILFRYRDGGAYLLHEFVVMPDHIHLLLTPSSTSSLEKCIQLVKGGSSHQIHKVRKQKMEIWQEGFYDWTIRDANDWQTKAVYIRMNPVRARLVESPQNWPHSSANDRFTLDPIPARYMNLTSGAKAQLKPLLTPGLKPRPPKDTGSTADSTANARAAKV